MMPPYRARPTHERVKKVTVPATSKNVMVTWWRWSRSVVSMPKRSDRVVCDEDAAVVHVINNDKELVGLEA